MTYHKTEAQRLRMPPAEPRVRGEGGARNLLPLLGDDDVGDGAGRVEREGQGLELDAHLVDVVLEHLRFRKAGVTALQAGQVAVALGLASRHHRSLGARAGLEVRPPGTLAAVGHQGHAVVGAFQASRGGGLGAGAGVSLLGGGSYGRDGARVCRGGRGRRTSTHSAT